MRRRFWTQIFIISMVVVMFYFYMRASSPFSFTNVHSDKKFLFLFYLTTNGHIKYVIRVFVESTCQMAASRQIWKFAEFCTEQVSSLGGGRERGAVTRNPPHIPHVAFDFIYLARSPSLFGYSMNFSPFVCRHVCPEFPLTFNQPEMKSPQTTRAPSRIESIVWP